MGDNPSKELNLATYISAGLTLVVVGVLSYVAFGSAGDALKEVLGFKAGWATPWICCALGLASGVAIGMITEYYTSADFKPTRTVAEYAVEGEAFVVTKGDAVGSKSVMLPVAIIGVALVISGSIGGTYGIAIAALRMLSFVGTTVSIDAFGPIADNAGGIAEIEAPLHISNVAIVCKKCGPTRIGYKLDGDKKYRVCRKCGDTL